MNKIVSFLTLALMTFSVTLAIYTLAREALPGSNTDYQTVLLINKDQATLQRVELASIQPVSNTQYTVLSIAKRPQGCNTPLTEKTFSQLIPVIKTSRNL